RVAWNRSMGERGNGPACDSTYRRSVTRTPASSRSSRWIARSADSPASTNPAKHENIAPPHAAFAPSSSRSPSCDTIATMTAGSVRGKSSRSHVGQCLAHPAVESGAAVPHVGQNPESTSQRPSAIPATSRSASARSSTAPTSRNEVHPVSSSPASAAGSAPSSSAAPSPMRPRNAHVVPSGASSTGEKTRPPSAILARSPRTRSARVDGSRRSVATRSGIARSSALMSNAPTWAGKVIDSLSAGRGVAWARGCRPSLGGMARSPLTLAAAASAALSDAEIRQARRLTAGGSGRFDAALLTLADGDDVVVRIPNDDDALADVDSEIIALRALTAGAREVLGIRAPEVRGSAPMDDRRVVVTSYLPGYQVEAAHIPAGRGVAGEIGRAIARVHGLPPSVVRSAGLPERSPADARADLDRLLDRIGRSGRVPVRLMVRWREADEDDRLWGYESTVVLGGAQATSFVLQNDARDEPSVTGVLDWQGLAIGDPAIDLHWTASAPDAADDVFRAYADASVRAPDGSLRVRARLHAELEFARWLVHGLDTHRSDVVDD